MKRIRKILAGVGILAAALMMPVMAVQAKNAYKAKTYDLRDVRKAEAPDGEWVEKKDGVVYCDEDGKTRREQWLQSEGKIYYVDKKGHPVTGWLSYGGNLYYMDKTGELHIGWLKGKDTYYLKKDGTLAHGKVKINGKTYYFGKNRGKRVKGWVKIGKSYYFFKKADGAMATSEWVYTDKKHHYVNAKGKRLTSTWQNIGGKRYYFDSDGARVTGEQYIDGKGYYFNKKGVYDPSVKVDPINPKGKMVALTFDDGPGPYTKTLLKYLKKSDAKATFFMVGSNVSHYKSVVKQMAEMGCELGNHSYDHPAFTTLSYESMRSQVKKTNKLIRNAAGKSPTVFRLPYGDGAENSTVLSSLKLPSIYWSIDTRDWANTGNAQHTIDAVLDNVQDGDIILMHDIHYNTVQAAKKIIPALKKRGYQMVTVSQLAKYKGKKTLKAGKTYYNFH